MTEIPTPERRLISIRRAVPADERAAYDAAWEALRAAATTLGGHAWRFLSADEEDVFLEFLEFGMESDLRADPDVLGAIQELHRSFGGVYPIPKTIEEWIEVPARQARIP